MSKMITSDGATIQSAVTKKRFRALTSTVYADKNYCVRSFRPRVRCLTYTLTMSGPTCAGEFAIACTPGILIVSLSLSHTYSHSHTHVYWFLASRTTTPQER